MEKKEKEFDRCIRCGKPLKNREARIRGYGDYCWKLYQQELAKKRNPLFKIFHKV